MKSGLTERPTRLRAVAAGTLAITLAGAAWGLDGSNDVMVTVPMDDATGWKTFELLSAGDALAGVAQEGFAWRAGHGKWDGLGAYRYDSSTLRVFLNHEVWSGTISQVDLDVPTLKAWIAVGHPNNTNSGQADSQGVVVKAISQAWHESPESIRRPCSGNVWMADTFGPGRGFADALYLTGEEVAGGYIYVLDIATRQLLKCPSLGQGRWENAAPIDTGRTDTVALLLCNDGSSSPAPLRLYVGMKNPAGNFLERNGLSDGTVYYWDPLGEETDIHGLENGMTMDGAWVADPLGAALLWKLEDVHPNMDPSSPGFGTDLAFASQGRAIYTMDFAAVDFVAGDLGVQRETTVRTLYRASTQAGGNNFSAMDNIVWSLDGNIYVNEDDGEGDVWKIDVESLRASYANSDFSPDEDQVLDILDAEFVSESSGIIDISEHIGYEPGGVFLITGQSPIFVRNQMALIVSPQATPLSTHRVVYFAEGGGSVVGGAAQLVASGAHAGMVTATPAEGFRFVRWSDGLTTPRRFERNVSGDFQATAIFELGSGYEAWISSYPGLVGADALPGADPDGDMVTNELEFGSNLDPSVKDRSMLVAGSGVAGLPWIGLRSLRDERRLVIEYIRRVGVPELKYYPVFASNLELAWDAGGREQVFPIDGDYERVVIEDTATVMTAATRYARVTMGWTGP
jgi:hypothetical protein